ncbi:MAG: 2'-5' RNA ligase family protein, partial [Actinobacteria bacterium]|nr:2'-5' RNA ligase family protein [Actinomycetota bacterium]NIU68535.1 2'-5' RNA ligase family protein [Actinomycetota bacterium]NIW30360.1 2'-5' RNA ligase family protein [Actinomycetota bacterium]
PTLVAKRFDGAVPEASIESEARLALAGTGPFECRVTGLGAFEAPVAGPAPVAYLAVESPGLEALHDELVEAFGAVPGLEGEDYVPHVTLARGGDVEALSALEGAAVEPVA